MELAELIEVKQEKYFCTYGYGRVWLELKKDGIFHNPQNCLWISYNSILLKGKPHPTVSIGMEAFALLLSNDLCQFSIFLWNLLSTQKIIVSASGNQKELTHAETGYRVLWRRMT